MNAIETDQSDEAVRRPGGGRWADALGGRGGNLRTGRARRRRQDHHHAAALTSIMDPSGGDAWVAGHHIVREAEKIKENIGYMSQRFGLYADLTVMENIDFYADIYSEPRRGRREKIDRLLSFSNLTPFKKRLAGNLSGGMKQKLGLACALIHTPKVLFLDEPTNGVDPVSRRDFWRILHQLLAEKVTIFVSTAYLDEADRCDRVGLIDRGRLLACGTPARSEEADAGHDSRNSHGRSAAGRRRASATTGRRDGGAFRRSRACRVVESRSEPRPKPQAALAASRLERSRHPDRSSRRWKTCSFRCWRRTAT